MKRIKSVKTHHKEPMDNRRRNLLFGSIGAVALIIVIIMLIENQGGRLKINNASDLKLEYMKAYFVDVEGPLHDPLVFENIDSDSKVAIPLGNMKLYGREANLELRFKFENYEKEYLIDAGYFNENFNGKINISFSNTGEDVIKLKIKATNGLLPSKLIQCDEETDIYYKEGILSE